MFCGTDVKGWLCCYTDGFSARPYSGTDPKGWLYSNTDAKGWLFCGTDAWDGCVVAVMDSVLGCIVAPMLMDGCFVPLILRDGCAVALMDSGLGCVVALLLRGGCIVALMPRDCCFCGTDVKGWLC